MKKLGLIVNPIAGMGGSVGLKGTDGVLSEAIARGAAPHAAKKTKRALLKLLPLIQDLTIITCGGDMGENALLDFLESPTSELKVPKESFSYEIVYISPNAKSSISTAGVEIPNSANVEYGSITSAEDTKEGAKAIAAAGADIIAFVGGDGTARDIYEAIGESLPVIGIPAGVKIYSPVYAQSPEKAGELLRLYLHGQTILTKETEVLDINEEDYRRDIINTSLFGYLRVPYERRFLQSRKAPSPMSEESRQRAIAAYIAENLMRDTPQDASKNNANSADNADSAEAEDIYYLIGPGSTTRCLAEYLGVENTLLGVDVVHKKQNVEKQTNAKTDTKTCTKTVVKTIAKDVTEQKILAYLEADQPKQVKLIITPTGGQGYLLGRGNQQISAEVIKKLGKKNIIVIATQEKLAGLLGESLRVDTGDTEGDELLRGYVKVITGYKEMQMYRVE